jgi:AcrR family transcriptional regulator
MKQVRYGPAIRRAKVLAVALPLAVEKGYTNLTRDEIAEACQISGGTLQHHFGTIAALKSALVLYAMEKRCLPVIGQAVVARDPAVSGMPLTLRRRALGALATYGSSGKMV